MLNARLLIFLGLWGGLSTMMPRALAQLPMGAKGGELSIGSMKWTVDNKGTLSVGKPGLKSVLQVRVEELSVVSDELVAAAAKENTASGSAEEKYEGDLAVTLRGAAADGTPIYEMTRSVKKVEKAGEEGVRVLDLVKGSSEVSSRYVKISYRTQFDRHAGIKVSQVSGVGEDKVGVAILLTPKAVYEPSMMLFVGDTDDHWLRTIDAGEDYVEWSYSGRMRPGLSLNFFHTATLCKNAQPKTIQTAIESLTADGMPRDPSLSKEVLDHLINFPTAVPKQEAPAVKGAQAPLQLVLLDLALKELNLDRYEDVDVLQLEGGELLQGSYRGAVMKIGKQELKQEEIAAILGDPGTREARVFLRDGRVLRGRLEWQEARFESESLGSVILPAEAPGRIIMRRSGNDGVMTPQPAAWMSDGRDGQVLPVKELSAAPLSFRWLGGARSVPWQEVVSIRALPAPRLESEVVVRDGTRWHGWIEWDGALSLQPTHWAREVTLLGALLEESSVVPPIPTQPAVMLQDGSVIVGEAPELKLKWRRQTDEMEIELADVAAVMRVPAQARDAEPLFELWLNNGTKLTGRPHENVLRWTHGAETFGLPWAWIQQLQLSPPDPVKKS